jgi:hypothetical protein
MTEQTAFETVQLTELNKGDTFSAKLLGQYSWGDEIVQGKLVGGYKVALDTRIHVVIELEDGKKITRRIHPSKPVRRYL